MLQLLRKRKPVFVPDSSIFGFLTRGLVFGGELQASFASPSHYKCWDLCSWTQIMSYDFVALQRSNNSSACRQKRKREWDLCHLLWFLFQQSSPFFTPGAKHSRVWGNSFTPFRCESSLTAIKAVCMRVLLYPIRPYCADVRWLSSGRLEKDSYPYAWEPRSRCDLSPDEALSFLARPLRSHIAGGSEDQWAPAITSSPLHISSLVSVGGPRGMRRVSLQHTGRNRDVFH